MGVWCYLSSCLPQCLLFFNMYYGVFWCFLQNMILCYVRISQGVIASVNIEGVLVFMHIFVVLFICFIISAMGLLSEA